MKFIRFSAIILALTLLASCHSNKTALPYFSDITVIDEGVLPELPDYKTTIRPDDELLITVTSSVPGASMLYNYALIDPAAATTGESGSIMRQLTYLVNSKGYITMPVLGEVYVEGLTVEQLQDKLTEMIRKDISDASVKVDLINFTVHVTGEVMRPSRINVRRNRYSILDALAESGDLTQYGERSNILLIRTEDGKRVFKHLNLNSSDIFNSPYFYLKQNDYIYVEPNNVKQSNARYDTNNAYRLQVITTIVSATSVIASLVIALAVK